MWRSKDGPALKKGLSGEGFARRPGARRVRFRPVFWEVLEARQLLSSGTIAASLRGHAATVVQVSAAVSRSPAFDQALETDFLNGVYRQFLRTTPSPSLIAPYLGMLKRGIPRDQVLSRLLTSPPARAAMVRGAYESLLYRDPTAAEVAASGSMLAGEGDLRTVLVTLASSREYLIRRGGGTGAGLVNALTSDLLGTTTGSGSMGTAPSTSPRARLALVRSLVSSRAFTDAWLEGAVRSITGSYVASSDLVARSRNALRKPGGLTRATALLLASNSARMEFAQGEAALRNPAPVPATAGAPSRVDFTDLAAASTSTGLTVPTDFGKALTFAAVDYTSTGSGQSAPVVAVPNGVIIPPKDQVTYEISFNAQTSGALLQAQYTGNGQTFNVPLLAIDADGKLTGGLFDVGANGVLSPSPVGAAPSSTASSQPVAPTLPSVLTSPLTLDYSVNSPSGDNPYTYQVVGPNNAMVSAASVVDLNWHHAALVIDGASERLYLDGLLVGAAQATSHYSLAFTDGQGNTYSPTGTGFLGGTVAPLPASSAVSPPQIGYPQGFVGSLDELRVWSVPRTAAQIEGTMDEPLSPGQDGLIGYYNFDIPAFAMSTLAGPPVGQVSVDASGQVWALDKSGTIEQYSGTAFEPVQTPFQTVTLAAAEAGAAYAIGTSGNLYYVNSGGSIQKVPLKEVFGTSLARPSFVSVDLLSHPWMISAGFTYWKNLSSGDGWWPEDSSSTPLGSKTSLAAVTDSNYPYIGPAKWGSVFLNAFATDSAGGLQIALFSAAVGWVQAQSNVDFTAHPLSQVVAGRDGSVWAIDKQGNVYQITSVTKDGTSYTCQLNAVPNLYGATSLAVAPDGTIYAVIAGTVTEFKVAPTSGALSFNNQVQGAPFDPVSTAATVTGTSLSAADITSSASTIPADPFAGVPRLAGYQAFAPYLAIPFSNSSPTVNLAAAPNNEVDYQVTLGVGDTLAVEVPGGQSAAGPFRVDFLGFTVKPTDGSHPVLVSYPALTQVSGELALNDLIQNNMAAAFIAPADGTYLIRIVGPSRGNAANAALQLQFSMLPGTSNSLLTLMNTVSVQGGGGATMATYTDPAAPPHAGIGVLLPSGDPVVTAYRLQAYGALVQAAKDYLGSNVSFTDFLDVDSGVNITPTQLFGLQTNAYNLVNQAPAKYLGSATPSAGLLSALRDVLGLLNNVDGLRQNLEAFLTVQDAWIQNEINNVLGRNTLSTIAQTIVDNQSQDNPPPYLMPPPALTPYSIGNDALIQTGRQTLSSLGGLISSLFFTGELAPFGSLFTFLVNLGSTLGATYASDTLKLIAAAQPKLVVPQDKNQVSTLIQAASTYQAQMVAGFSALQDLGNNAQFLYPLFSNVGLLRALGNLNPLILGSSKQDDQLGPNNPTASAVTNAAWKALLPTYFQWVPVDSSTESVSKNFDNFYANVTPQTPGDSLGQLEAAQFGTPFTYPGYSDNTRITFAATTPNHFNFQYANYPPTSMATAPTGTASAGATAHPERFFTLVTSQVGQSADGTNTYYVGRKDPYQQVDKFSFAYTGQGLTVLGWKLVDKNNVEIDPRTAKLIFPTGTAVQPATSGPAFLAGGGGWYVNLAPVSVPQGASLYATQALPTDVFTGWFGQASFAPTSTVTGTLTVGAVTASSHFGDSLQTNAPSYSITFGGITSSPPSSQTPRPPAIRTIFGAATPSAASARRRANSPPRPANTRR
jgi:hypothetical protein